MNKVFKIVFNAARGTRMVVNETTSSVQSGKKAAVTVAVVGALASGVATAGIVEDAEIATSTTMLVNEVSIENSDYYVGIRADGTNADKDIVVNVAKGKLLTVTTEGASIDGHTRLFGAGTKAGNSLTVNGDTKFVVNATGDGQARVFRVNGGKQSFDGKTVATATTVNGDLYGFSTWENSETTVTGELLDVTLTSKNASYVAGVYNFNGSTMNVEADAVKFNVTNESGKQAVGIRGNASETNITAEDLDVVVKGGQDQTIGVFMSTDKGTRPLTEINLTSDDMLIDVEGNNLVVAVSSSGADGTLNLKGEKAIVKATSSNGSAVGFEAQYHGTLSVDNDVTLTVKAKNEASGVAITESQDYEGGGSITVKNLDVQASASAGKAYGIYNVVSSDGATGTITVTGDAKLEASGSDINSYGIYANKTETTLKGNVTINAENGYSVWAAGSGTVVTLGSEGKTVDLTGDVQVAEGSTLNLYGEVTLNGTSTIAGTLGGEAQILLGDEDASVTVSGTNNSKATIGSTGEVTDALGGDVSKLADKFVGFDEAEKIVMQEGEVIGAVSADLEGGEVVANSVTQAVNKKTEALAEQVTLAPQMIQRIMMNDVRKRMGDLRAAEGTHGVWARYNGGQMSGQGMDADFNMVQVGIDTVPVVDAPRFGVAFSYAQTEADATNGLATTDMDSFSLAFYGTKMYDNGMFVDVIGRMATMDTEMTVQGNKAEMDNVALSLSGEFGWRFDVTDQFFIEPSAELTYTYTNADTFKMGRGEYELESVDSLVGRAGFAAGFKCPANKGDVYVRAAVVHEFMGDSTMNSMVNGRSATPVESDGEDTYFEYAVGAQFNVNKNTYVYADVERTEGANVDEDWRANVGVRFAF